MLLSESQARQKEGRFDMKNTREALVEIGIFPSYKGFDYILRAVEIFKQSKFAPQITKDVYPVIAKEANSTAPRV